MNRTEPSQGHTRSLARPAAFALAAAVMLVPANLLPIMSTKLSGQLRDDTIFSGTVELWERGFWPLAVVVFTASIAIPLLKLAGIGWLLMEARRGGHERARPLTRLYAALDLIGRWSMLDVFLVAFLSGTVRFGALALVEPKAGVLAFAAAVVLTMLATRAFDPRVLWPAPEPSPSS